MSQKLTTSPRSRKNAQALFLREKSLRSKNPSLTSVSAIVSSDTRKISEYARQLREKQKVRRMYGINENQFHSYYVEATASHDNSSERLLQLLEMRLDNFIYRAGFGLTRAQSRQFASHGLFSVNGRRVNVPSFRIAVGDVIAPTRKFDLLEEREFDMVPVWISLDKKKLVATVSAEPTREDIDPDINEQLIIEFYSR